MTLAIYLRELRELQERWAAEAQQAEPQPAPALTDEQCRAVDDTWTAPKDQPCAA